MNDSIIERLERLEELVKEMASQPQRFPVYPSVIDGCQHSRAVPSHMVITQRMTFVCPDCGETITVNPTSPY